MAALLGEPQAERAPDAVCRPGDDGDAILETAHSDQGIEPGQSSNMSSVQSGLR